MPAQRKIILTGEEDRTLKELWQAQTVPQRVRERAHMLRLNAQGYSTAEIATIFECHLAHLSEQLSQDGNTEG